MFYIFILLINISPPSEAGSVEQCHYWYTVLSEIINVDLMHIHIDTCALQVCTMCQLEDT